MSSRPRTAEDKQRIAEATAWVLQQMADPNVDDITYAAVEERFGISHRAAQEIATKTRFHTHHLHLISNPDEESRTGTCSRCGPVRVWKRTRGNKFNWICSTKGAERNRTYLAGGPRHHGLNKGQARRLREGRQCEVPSCTKPSETVDHCHNELRIRGVLCRDHNLALGYVHDSIEELEGLIEYLKMTDGVDGLTRLGYAG